MYLLLKVVTKAIKAHRWHSRFAPHAEGWVFESQSRQNKVIKPCSDRPTVKHSVIGVSVTALEYDYHKRMSLSQYVWQVKKTLTAYWPYAFIECPV